MKPQDNSTSARTAAWAFTLDEARQVISLIQLMDRPAMCTLLADFHIESIYTSQDESVAPAVRKYLQQILSAKLGAVFALRGDGHGHRSQEIANNKLIQKWRTGMNRLATDFEIDVKEANAIYDRLMDDRNKLIAHFDGSAANVQHSSEQFSREVTMRTVPIPMQDAELQLLADYLTACTEFCRWAFVEDGQPIFPMRVMKNLSLQSPLFRPPPFAKFAYAAIPDVSYGIFPD